MQINATSCELVGLIRLYFNIYAQNMRKIPIPHILMRDISDWVHPSPTRGRVPGAWLGMGTHFFSAKWKSKHNKHRNIQTYYIFSICSLVTWHIWNRLPGTPWYLLVASPALPSGWRRRWPARTTAWGPGRARRAACWGLVLPGTSWHLLVPPGAPW